MEDLLEQKETAVFNMAVDTLRRLGDILREIKIISVMSGELMNQG